MKKSLNTKFFGEFSRLRRCFKNLILSDDIRFNFRPGFTRINLPFFYPDEEINFIIDALTFVAKYAWTFLPFYELNPSTGQWRYCNDKRSDMGKHLSNISYERGVMRWNKPTVKSAGAAPSSFKVNYEKITTMFE